MSFLAASCHSLCVISFRSLRYSNKDEYKMEERLNACERTHARSLEANMLVALVALDGVITRQVRGMTGVVNCSEVR